MKTTTPKNIAVILSGCGVYDGSEIHESVFTMWAIAKAGARYHLFAPDMEQHHVINHLSGQPTEERRNVLVESARIARGEIQALGKFNAEAFDALVLPGGFGAAKNLSDFAFKGSGCTIIPEVEKAIRDMHHAGKPIGALCIAPVILARVLGNNLKLTIGSDEETSTALEEMGAQHVQTSHGQVIIDQKMKVATSPCYMLDANITQIAQGAEKMVNAVLEMM